MCASDSIFFIKIEIYTFEKKYMIVSLLFTNIITKVFPNGYNML